ncbi:hypothetical protein CEUSTIGMA_g3164.t1 [Chlamydomonas eustigma]|uniref:t-SNARE coiled-coil homology domain-containing protein n=1 Tax=Chlamydomonas eustigma TaxID=1157962 RepID=A0A250WY19_9CHLO|nr:hypothetical protein CEUSTIGMA_g3164.t1 [Chlamydomonas eustigma]|eukprot:GAX75721.1 hypothetical protein CEUSTIGMA_g3164.t1 [Chlamydomonas eustigma]
MAWQGSSSREGLSSRSQGSDQVHIHIDKGFDFDSEVDILRSHVGRIKKLSQAIDEETKVQGSLINSLEESMERARMSLKRTMVRLNIAYKQAQSNHMLLLVLFAVVLFISIYVISKIYKLGRHIIG